VIELHSVGMDEELEGRAIVYSNVFRSIKFHKSIYPTNFLTSSIDTRLSSQIRRSVRPTPFVISRWRHTNLPKDHSPGGEP